jgi:hypothetical protein
MQTLFRHAALEEPAPYSDTGASRVLERTGFRVVSI